MVDVTTTPSYNIWQDSYGIEWTIVTNEDGMGVSGTAVVPGVNYGDGCPSVTFRVTGYILPSTQLDGSEGRTAYGWTGSDPYLPPVVTA